MELVNNMLRNNSLPFRLGCTSYVYPDDILPNVEKMASVIDDIEIILFEWNGQNDLPGKNIIEKLAEISKKNELTYTVHLPINLKAGSKDKSERQEYINAVKNIIYITETLNPFAYIMHFEGIKPEADKTEVVKWKYNVTEVCTKILENNNIKPEKIAVENLSYPAEWHIDIVEKFGFSLCLDIGHLWLHNHDIDIFKKYFSKIKVIHLHGVYKGKDHISLKKTDKKKLDDFLNCFLKNYKNVVTCEVFNKDDTFESIAAVKDSLSEWQK